MSAAEGSSTRERTDVVPAQSYNGDSHGSAAEVEETETTSGVEGGGVLVEQEEMRREKRVKEKSKLFLMAVSPVQ